MRLNLGTNTNPTNFHSAFETRIRPIDPPTAISNTEKHCRHVVLVIQGERGRRYRYPVGVGLLEDPGLKSELYIYIHHPHPPHPHPPHPQRPTRHTIHNGFKRHYFRLPRPLPPALGIRQWNLQFPRPWRLPHCWQHWQRKWGTSPPLMVMVLNYTPPTGQTQHHLPQHRAQPHPGRRHPDADLQARHHILLRPAIAPRSRASRGCFSNPRHPQRHQELGTRIRGPGHESRVNLLRSPTNTHTHTPLTTPPLSLFHPERSLHATNATPPATSRLHTVRSSAPLGHSRIGPSSCTCSRAPQTRC